MNPALRSACRTCTRGSAASGAAPRAAAHLHAAAAREKTFGATHAQQLGAQTAEIYKCEPCARAACPARGGSPPPPRMTLLRPPPAMVAHHPSPTPRTALNTKGAHRSHAERPWPLPAFHAAPRRAIAVGRGGGGGA